ncbi:DUF7709 family protein [Crenobacter luteus]|uniref:DUF7709 family protein n=1 Tax=Crenobacter luteus TaxID=1452487 RepID=UPI000A467E6B|nr:hypothetical protein [Crenobacter luteus]
MPSTTTPAGTEQLAAVNRRILSDGETLPTVTLKDGSRVQTGTVAAMLHNIARYNAGERGEVERELALAVPTLAGADRPVRAVFARRVAGRRQPGAALCRRRGARLARRRAGLSGAGRRPLCCEMRATRRGRDGKTA